MRIIAFFVLLTSTTIAFAAGSGGQAAYTGGLSKHQATMKIVDAYALWDKKMNRVVVYLLPSRLGAKQAARLNRQPAFLVLSHNDSPDQHKWSWYPYARVLLDFKHGASIDENSLKTFYVTMTGIEKKGWNDNHRWRHHPNRYVKSSIAVRTVNGSRYLEFSSRRQKGTDLHWDFRIRTPLRSPANIDLSNRP